MFKKQPEDIINFCKSLWPDLEDDGITVSISDREERVDITVSKMYESPHLNLDILMQLAEFLGTKNINDDDRFSNEGCETCDYGSSYGFTLTARPEKSAQA